MISDLAILNDYKWHFLAAFCDGVLRQFFAVFRCIWPVDLLETRPRSRWEWI